MLKEVLNEAKNKGIMIVAASGNLVQTYQKALVLLQMSCIQRNMKVL